VKTANITRYVYLLFVPVTITADLSEPNHFIRHVLAKTEAHWKRREMANTCFETDIDKRVVSGDWPRTEIL
jgi:hypothetical protein